MLFGIEWTRCDFGFKAIRDHRSSMHSQSFGGSQVHTSTSAGSQFESSSVSAHDINEANEESYLRFKAMESQKFTISTHDF